MRRIFKIIIIGFGLFVLLFALFLFGLKQILEQSSIKSLVKEKIESVVNLNLNYSEIDTVLFPFPGIEMRDITVKEEKQQILLVDKLNIEFDLKRIFNQEFQIRSIEVEGGFLLLERSEDGNFPLASKFKSEADEIEEGREKVEEGPRALVQYLPKILTVRNFNVFYSDLSNQTKQELNLKNIQILLDKEDLMVDLNLEADLNQNPISILSKLSLVKDEWTLDSMRTKSSVTLNHFLFRQMGDIVKIFPKVDLRDSYIDLNLQIEKDSKDELFLHFTQVNLGGIKSKKDDIFPNITVQSSIFINTSEKKLNLRDLSFQYGDHLSLFSRGELFQDFSNTSTLVLSSERMDLDKTLSYFNLFLKPEWKNSVYFAETKQTTKPAVTVVKDHIQTPMLNLTLDLKKLIIARKFISYIQGPINLKDNQLFMKGLEVGIFDGKANLHGYLDLKSKKLHLESKLVGINVEKAIASATTDKLLKGRLRSDVIMDLNLNQTSDNQSYMKLKSKFHIDKGQLLGYANFIKPVAEVGKVFNFSGGKGESTEFETIDGFVQIANQNIQLHSFEMKGVGLNASGNGVYNANGKIDMKFTVSLAGVVGKAVKLPIIYRGYYGKNFAFIDPVWLATVYTGTMIGGPLGTVLGSMAGTQASERVDATIGSVKNTFNRINGFFFDDKKDGKDKK